jgi:tetratricopeptide (TPR) repeat protein
LQDKRSQLKNRLFYPLDWEKTLFNEAMKDCDEAIKMNPNSALAYNNKGFALELMGKQREATLNYEFACNLNMALGCDNLKRLITSMNKK